MKTICDQCRKNEAERKRPEWHAVCATCAKVTEGMLAGSAARTSRS